MSIKLLSPLRRAEAGNGQWFNTTGTVRVIFCLGARSPLRSPGMLGARPLQSVRDRGRVTQFPGVAGAEEEKRKAAEQSAHQCI